LHEDIENRKIVPSGGHSFFRNLQADRISFIGAQDHLANQIPLDYSLAQEIKTPGSSRFQHV